MISNRFYDFLKWFGIAGLHASGVAYGQLAHIWGLPYSQAIPETLDIIGVLLAAFLAWESYEYSKSFGVVSVEKQLEYNEEITDFIEPEV